jgi:hypothetical protein
MASERGGGGPSGTSAHGCSELPPAARTEPGVPAPPPAPAATTVAVAAAATCWTPPPPPPPFAFPIPPPPPESKGCIPLADTPLPVGSSRGLSVPEPPARPPAPGAAAAAAATGPLRSAGPAGAPGPSLGLERSPIRAEACSTLRHSERLFQAGGEAVVACPEVSWGLRGLKKGRVV